MSSKCVVFNQLSLLSFFLHTCTLVAWPLFDVLRSSLPCQYTSMFDYLFVSIACITRPFVMFAHSEPLFARIVVWFWLCRLTNYLKCHMRTRLKATRQLEESLASMTTLGSWPPTALFRVQLANSDTRKWREHLQISWAPNHPLALFRVQLDHLNDHKWCED